MIIFILEMVMKIIVYGFLINGPDSYLKNGWNILDFIIIMVTSVGVYLEHNNH